MTNPSQSALCAIIGTGWPGAASHDLRCSDWISDRELIRSFAKRLAENDVAATRLRADVGRSVGQSQHKRGGILAALRRSPMVGADLDLTRPFEAGRDVDL